MASLSVFGTMGGTSSPEPVTFTGTGTVWLSGAPTFAMTGAGNSVGSIVVVDDTHCRAVVTCGSTNGPFVITDSTTSATCTFTIATARTYDLTDPSIYGHYVQIEGGLVLTSLSGTVCWNNAGVSYDTEIRFRATCAQIDFQQLISNGVNRLSIDRVDQDLGSSRFIPGLATFGWWCHSTGLDPTTEHEYICWWGGSNQGRGNPGVTQLRLLGGTGINTAPVAARPLVVAPGDSVGIGAGIIGGGYIDSDSTVCFWHDLGVISNYQVSNHSQGSQPISRRPVSLGGPTGTEAYTAGETAFIVATTPTPIVVYVLIGVVDVLGLYPTGQFGIDYRTMIEAYRAGLPAALIICPHIQPRGPTGTDLHKPDLYNAQIDAVVAALGDPRIVVSTVIYDVVKASGLVGYHPNYADSPGWAAAIKTELDGLLGPASGAMAKTEAHDSLAAISHSGSTGSMGRTEAHDTLVAAGRMTCSGTLARTEHHDRLVTRKRRHPRWFPGLARRPRIKTEDKERVS